MSTQTRMVRSSGGARLTAALTLLLALMLSVSLPAAQALSFDPAEGVSFNSTFDTDSAGWAKVSGNWYLTASGYYKSDGLAGKWASIKHSGSYTDFVYAVRMKRSGAESGATALWLRGSVTPLNDMKYWDDGYWLGYTNLGSVSVYKRVSGISTALMSWVANPAVNSGDWNTLKVLLYDNFLGFYLNGELVYLDDHTLPIQTGQVGIGFYDGGPGDKLSVNSAKLSVIAPLPSFSLQSLGLPNYSVPEGEPIQLR